MRLHWSPKSPYVRKVMMCAHELNCVSDITLTRSVAAMLSPNPAIMLDNPLNKIPTLVLASGQALFDSRVICEYLNARYKGKLFPVKEAQYWEALRWQAFGDGLLDALILWRNERERTQPFDALIAAFEFKVNTSLAQLDQEVEALRAHPFSIGSITIACVLGYLDFRFANLEWRSHAPRLSQWFEGIAQRPSVQLTQVSVDPI
jgi:glutathione S-transferase